MVCLIVRRTDVTISKFVRDDVICIDLARYLVLAGHRYGWIKR